MIVEIVIFILTLFVGYFFYMHKKSHKYFDERGIKYLPGVPLFGNTFNSTFLKNHYIDDLGAVYNAFPEERYVGYIEGTSPVILIRDPLLIKNITVKDFHHFTDHKVFFSEEVEPLFGGSLFMMKGERWHSMRTTLSPAFTSSKMRMMMPFMTEISDNIVEYLKGHLNEDIDVEDVIRRYTNDVIASAAFGLQVNSLKDRDNEFYTIGKNLFSFTFMQRVYVLVVAIFPNITKKLGIKIFSDEVMNFFSGLAINTMEQREKNKIYRPDMIQLLMETSKGQAPIFCFIYSGVMNICGTLKDESDAKDSSADDTSKPKADKEWSLEELAGQIFIFFAAGYETSASALVMCIHELAVGPDIQEKLYQEIKKYKEEHGHISFDTINCLKYLDCVLSGKWAAAIFMDRTCTEAYELPPPREGLKPVQLQPGDVVYNMVNCIHMDPVHYPNPQTFDPERFSEENKHKIKPFTYTPFGMGPRSCIGVRFAQLELKVMVFNLVLNFKIVKCPKTMDPLLLKPHQFNIQPRDGSFVRFEPRS